MAPKDSLSIVIPAYNEALRLPGTLRLVADWASRAFASYEIIVVDDGSSDRTADVARWFAGRRAQGHLRVIQTPANRGKGAALRRGILASRGEYVLCTDADLSTPIGEADKLLRRLAAGADVAIGSRKAPGGAAAGQPLYRSALSFVSAALIRAVLNLPYRDTQCGFKLYRRDAARSLFEGLSLMRFSYDFEILARARAQGLQVKEVGVAWQHHSASSVRPMDVMVCLVDVFRVRFGLTRGAPMIQLVRFMGVGVVNTLVDTGVYVVLTRFVPAFEGALVAAKFLSFLAATVSSLLLNRRWTFGVTAPLGLREVAKFYTTVSFSMALNVSAMYALVHWAHMYDLVALAAATAVTFGVNYTLSRLWVFKTPPPPESGQSRV